MRISRTIVMIVVAAATIAAQAFGIDVKVTDLGGADGTTLMELLNWLALLAAAVFRVLATEKADWKGRKTGEPLSG